MQRILLFILAIGLQASARGQSATATTLATSAASVAAGGTFTAASTLNIAHPNAMVTGDLNGNGHLDLAVVDIIDNVVVIALGNGNGTFTVKSSPATQGSPMAMVEGDFNSDGIPDLASRTTHRAP